MERYTIVGYSNASGQSGLTVVTWGQKMTMSWDFLYAYADEMYAVLSADWIAKSGQSASNEALASLQADLKSIT